MQVSRVLEYEFEGSYLGGYKVLSGTLSITIWSPGFLQQTHIVDVSPSSRYFQFFSVPADGQTRAGVQQPVRLILVV